MKRVLIVAAHPDDEVIGCAGVSAKLIESGYEIHTVFMTDGVSARQKKTEQALIRNGSLTAASKIVKYRSIESFDFPDNKMDSVPLLEVVKVIEDVIERVKPSVIYTHHSGDLNIDHHVTHRAVMTACRPQPGFCVKEIYAFEVLSSTEWSGSYYDHFHPNVFVDISDYIDLKVKALEAYKEEMRGVPHSRSIENIIRLNQYRGNSVGCYYAEAFMLLRKII